MRRCVQLLAVTALVLAAAPASAQSQSPLMPPPENAAFISGQPPFLVTYLAVNLRMVDYLGQQVIFADFWNGTAQPDNLVGIPAGPNLTFWLSLSNPGGLHGWAWRESGLLRWNDNQQRSGWLIMF